MAAKIGPEDVDLRIKFGSGLHTRASEDEIDAREAADGFNFQLDAKNLELRNRKPFDLIGTVPNGAEVRGGASLRKADGSVSTLVQAGDTVYEWDGITQFDAVGTVVSTAKLRGHWQSHNWILDDKVIITDLNLVEEVAEWDGTTFQNTTFLDETASPFGTFFAKYLSVSKERAVFGHVRDAGAITRHMMVGSERGNFETISVAQRPSSALGEADPFFLLTPDLKPINGMVGAFGTLIFSTEQGEVFKVTGESSVDFAIDDFYPGSFASGDESVAYIGNDIVFGRQGRIETLRDTERFGDSETDDLSLRISDSIEGFDSWTDIYNSRLNRVYMFPGGQSEIWVLQTALREEKTTLQPEREAKSPWMKWTTEHAIGFQPTFVMSMLDPIDKLEYVFMGDSSGNFYRLEGSGANGDGGANLIKTQWLTRLFSVPQDAQAFRIEGYIKYRKNVAATVTLTFEYAGETSYNYPLTIEIPALDNTNVFGGEVYYGGEFFYGIPFEGRLTRQHIAAAGQANEFQLRIEVEGNTDFEINEIGLKFTAAS